MPVQCTCPQCGRVFVRCASQVRVAMVSYCGRACYNEASRRTPSEYLARFVDRSGGEGACWPWMGCRDSKGYGRISRGGKARPLLAHRTAWEIANGTEVLPGLFVRHLCPGGGNPSCCNPSHLEPGTPQQNSDDMVRAGRQSRGLRNPMARVDDGLASEIYRRRATGETLKSIATDFGISIGAVWNIANGRTWTHTTAYVAPNAVQPNELRELRAENAKLRATVRELRYRWERNLTLLQRAARLMPVLESLAADGTGQEHVNWDQLYAFQDQVADVLGGQLPHA